MAKVDAYVLGPEDYAEIPELSDADFARGTLFTDGKPVARALAVGKSQVTVRLDLDVLSHFKAGGRGWQTRLNAALRRAMEAEAHSAA